MRNLQCSAIVVLSFAFLLTVVFTPCVRAADVTVNSADSYIIEVDTDDDGTGAFIVRDYDGASPTVTIINADAQTMTLGSAATQVTGTLSVTGGITTAGSISGVTTLTASGGITGGSLATGGTLSVTGTTTLTGALTANGGATVNNGATVYSGSGTGNQLIVDGASARLANTANTNSVAVNSTNTTITGTTLINGATTITSPNSMHIVSVTDALTQIDGGLRVFSGIGTGTHLGLDPNGIDALAGNNNLLINGVTNEVSLQADNDASGGNARGSLRLTPSSAQLMVNTNGGTPHGLDINQSRTILSGGTGSTSMTLNDGGARFANTFGGPTRVTGVADGWSDFDAVNLRQLHDVRDRAYSGIASVAALAAIPSPAAGKNYSLGTGFGNYAGNSALAVGAKANLSEGVTVGLGFGYTGDDWTTNAGLGFSW